MSVESQDEHQQQEEAPVLIPGAVGGHRVIHPIGQVVMSSLRSKCRVIRPWNGQKESQYSHDNPDNVSQEVFEEERDPGNKSGDQKVRIGKRVRRMKRDSNFHYY